MAAAQPTNTNQPTPFPPQHLAKVRALTIAISNIFMHEALHGRFPSAAELLEQAAARAFPMEYRARLNDTQHDPDLCTRPLRLATLPRGVYMKLLGHIPTWPSPATFEGKLDDVVLRCVAEALDRNVHQNAAWVSAVTCEPTHLRVEFRRDELLVRFTPFPMYLAFSPAAKEARQRVARERAKAYSEALEGLLWARDGSVERAWPHVIRELVDGEDRFALRATATVLSRRWERERGRKDCAPHTVVMDRRYKEGSEVWREKAAAVRCAKLGGAKSLSFPSIDAVLAAGCFLEDLKNLTLTDETVRPASADSKLQTIEEEEDLDKGTLDIEN